MLSNLVKIKWFTRRKQLCSLKAIYSTSMDKEDKSEGEITYNNDDKYDSNYEGEEFEDQDDEDDDDDFALPKNHEQNKASDK